MWLGFGADYREEVGIEASTPLEQAYPLVFLCSDAAAGVTGITMITDAGYFGCGVTGSFPPAQRGRRLPARQVWADLTPVRPLPQLTPCNEWFWTSGADGHAPHPALRDCGTLVHPPVPICPACRSRAWEPTRRCRDAATVVGFTVNQHQWLARLRAAVRDRQRRARRGPDASASPRTSSAASPTTCTSARRSRSASSSTTTCGSRCSSRPATTDAVDRVAEPQRPDAAAAAQRRPLRAPRRCCPASAARRSAAG